MATADALVPVADDVTTDLTVLATSPAEMATAQKALAQWFAGKVQICQRDLRECEDNLMIASQNGWKTAGMDRQRRNARERLSFYEKCKAAVDAGYCIVPNFPVDMFAIRTTRKNPDRNLTDYSYADRTQHSNSPPIGEGENLPAQPVQYGHTITTPNDKGELVKKKEYWAERFGEEIEFPVSICKPQILDATAQALARKVFDEVGLVQQRQKRDPIIVGRIYDKSVANGGKAISFLIAWWVDSRDL